MYPVNCFPKEWTLEAFGNTCCKHKREKQNKQTKDIK